MYVVKSSKQFRKAIKRLQKSGRLPRYELESVINGLIAGKKLPVKYKDHKLTGNMANFRECHIRFDLLLVYRIYKNELILLLLDVGSHEDLFGK